MRQPPSRREFFGHAAAFAAMGGAMGSFGCRPTRDMVSPDLTGLSATAAVAAMKNGDITAEAYAGALLDQAARLGSLNAFRVLEPEAVMEAARAADRAREAGGPLGPLHGLPIPVKDSVNWTAWPTSNGTATLRDFRPSADASVLTSLVSAGAIVMGKTNLHELSLGWSSNNPTFGAVHNPYDPAYVPGGSSGGSGVAVGARMAPIAVAEDTFGSIRIPATMCGICGLRPTYGRYPDDGVMPLTRDKFDQVGPLARSVEDLALFDSAVTGDTSPLMAPALDGVRIGVADFYFANLDPGVERVVAAALERLRATGATIVQTDVPDEVKAALDTGLAIIRTEGPQTIAEFLEVQGSGVSVEQMVAQAGPDVQAFFAREPLPVEALEAAIARRAAVGDAIRDHFIREDIVALAMPPALIPPFRIGEDGSLDVGGEVLPIQVTMGRNISLGSCASMSCLVLPAGLTSGGLPVGLEFDALPGTDRELLALGLSLERALGPIPPPPGVADV